MKNLSIDIETYSSKNLSKCGAYAYTELPDFEILLFGYAADDDAVSVVDLASGEQIPGNVLDALNDPVVTKWAFNAAFERVCLSRHIGQWLDPASWRCTMVWAATLGLPLSLEQAGMVLGLEKQKLREGRELIRYFCQPCTPTKANGNRERNLPGHAPDKWTAFVQYNRRDVEVERAIQQKLSNYPVPAFEWANYVLDQRINDRGIALDMELVHMAIACDCQTREAHIAKARTLTGLENPNSTQQLKAWLHRNGLSVASLSKSAVADLLMEAEGVPKEVLLLRRELAKSSVKKYTAMQHAKCGDGRARGLIQFYGANRTGRFASKRLQIHNLPQNHMSDLDHARELVRSGHFDAVDMQYSSVPFVLSELIRTAFVPKPGHRFLVADFSAIEARVIAWLAGEQWRMDVFNSHGRIYEASASQMFHVPIDQVTKGSMLRQKGKVAELACIAKGSLLLTQRGLVPIEHITTDHLLWDGVEWVRHGGVIFKGEREVISYDGLTATADHLVWVEGQSQPVRFGVAAASGAHLVQTGDGGRALRLGGDYQRGEAVERYLESLLCSHPVSGVQCGSVAVAWLIEDGKIKGMPIVFSSETGSPLAGSATEISEAAMRESTGAELCSVWRTGYPVSIRYCVGGWAMDHGKCTGCEAGVRVGSDRQRRTLRGGQSAVCAQAGQSGESTEERGPVLQSIGMAVCADSCHADAFLRHDTGGGVRFSRACGHGTPQELATHQSTARVYDILNAGPRHRFTVSGRLVHNCGYGGGVGALVNMGALAMGVTEAELPSLIRDWRNSNPKIVRFWWAVGDAALKAVRDRTVTETHGIRVSYEQSILFIRLPSGRRLAYLRPRIQPNKFGRDGLTYEGVGESKKWTRIDTYGPKLVENIVQATSRDLLTDAMRCIDAASYSIVMHVHDEVIVEATEDQSLDELCALMAAQPDWAKGLPLRADGYACAYYRKD